MKLAASVPVERTYTLVLTEKELLALRLLASNPGAVVTCARSFTLDKYYMKTDGCLEEMRALLAALWGASNQFIPDFKEAIARCQLDKL